MKRKILTLVFLFTSINILIAQSAFTNYKVNSSSANQPNEVSIAVNPANQNYIAAGSNLYYLYVSSDAGKTWTQKQMSSVWKVWGDPCLVYDANGNLFYGHLSDQRNLSPGYWIDRIVVQRSTNNGTTWDYDVGVGFTPPVKQQDKEWLAVDLTNSNYRNNIYMAWTEFDKYGSSSSTDSTRILFSRSTNSGQSWSTPIRISSRGGDCIDSDNTVEGCVPAVGPNGEVYLSWSGPLGIMFDKSIDGGITFGKDKLVTTLYGGWDFYDDVLRQTTVPGIYRANGFPVTGCDISNSPYRGNIYINWSDQKDGDTDIYFAKSTDGGSTWSSPKKVNNDLQKRHQFFNWMSVDPKTGKIYIIFYDRRDALDPNSTQTHVYLAKSDDGGETFKNYRISESPFFPVNNIFFGDYTNISAYDGKIYPIWMRMDGTTMSIWTAPILDSQLITDIEDKNENIVQSYNLFQNYPNPFNPSTIIRWQLAVNSFVTLKIYDMLGREAATIVDEYKNAGNYNSTFNAQNYNLTSGIYFYQIRAGNYMETKKMVLAK